MKNYELGTRNEILKTNILSTAFAGLVLASLSKFCLVRSPKYFLIVAQEDCNFSIRIFIILR